MKKRNRKTERNELIYAQRQQLHMTQKAIAIEHGISITRVRQIIEAEDKKRGK